MTITTTLVELIQYGCGIFGIVAIIIWAFSKRGNIPEIIGISGVVLLVLGVVITVVVAAEKFSLKTQAIRTAHISECQVDHEAAFAELHPRWQTFYQNLNKLTDKGLQEEFICRFVKSTPPRISIDDYGTLIGAKLARGHWTHAQVVLAHSVRLREVVIFDFTKFEKPE